MPSPVTGEGGLLFGSGCVPALESVFAKINSVANFTHIHVGPIADRIVDTKERRLEQGNIAGHSADSANDAYVFAVNECMGHEAALFEIDGELFAVVQELLQFVARPDNLAALIVFALIIVVEFDVFDDWRFRLSCAD